MKASTTGSRDSSKRHHKGNALSVTRSLLTEAIHSVVTTHSVNKTQRVPILADMTDTQDPQAQEAPIQDAQQQVLDEARKVNDERLKAVEELAAAVASRVDVERQLHE